jgi:hypothetical protein
MGTGDTKMGTPTTPEGSQDTGHTESTVSSVEEFFERVSSKSRELDLVVGSTKDAIQQSDHRRVESLQRSFDEKIQELEKKKSKEYIKKILEYKEPVFVIRSFASFYDKNNIP